MLWSPYVDSFIVDELMDDKRGDVIAILQMDPNLREKEFARFKLSTLLRLGKDLTTQVNKNGLSPLQQLNDYERKLHPIIMERFGLYSALEFVSDSTQGLSSNAIKIIKDYNKNHPQLHQHLEQNLLDFKSNVIPKLSDNEINHLKNGLKTLKSTLLKTPTSDTTITHLENGLFSILNTKTLDSNPFISPSIVPQVLPMPTLNKSSHVLLPSPNIVHTTTVSRPSANKFSLSNKLPIINQIESKTTRWPAIAAVAVVGTLLSGIGGYLWWTTQKESKLPNGSRLQAVLTK